MSTTNPAQALPPVGLMRLPAAARLTGLSPAVFEAAIRRGQIPLRIVTLGRWRYVSATAYAAWRKQAESPTP
jgi:predicted site-specific integrase-resolvase